MNLSVADLEVTARALEPAHIPSFRGKTLRGAFGLSIKRLVCHLRAPGCDACVLREKCPFAVLFLGVPPADRTVMRKYPRIPQPFVLLIDDNEGVFLRPGDELRFGIRLFGPATAFYPYVVAAVRTMLECGLGGSRARFELSRVESNGKPVFVHNDLYVKHPTARSVIASSQRPMQVRSVEIECVTPVRLQVAGQVAATVSLESILRATVRRAKILSAFYGDGELPQYEAVLDASRLSQPMSGNIRPVAVRRFSSRQNRHMNLSGVLGRAVFSWPHDAPGPTPWLDLASILHLGKATSFGFGRIRYRVNPHDTHN